MSTVRHDQIEQLAFEGPLDPSFADDLSAGFPVGSRWLNTATKRIWVSVDSSPGAAIWREDTPDSASTDFDRIVTAVARNIVVDNLGSVEIPLVVINNAGNVVVRL